MNIMFVMLFIQNLLFNNKQDQIKQLSLTLQKLRSKARANYLLV
jgi:hypothetical protein